MIWLTWRQQRLPGLVATAAVAAVCVALFYVALRARQIADAVGLAVDSDVVRAQLQSELAQNPIFGVLSILVLFLPAFIAVFAGAALLAREFEERTHRLVWTQGISRERWFLSKTALLAAALMVASAALALTAALAAPVAPPLAPMAGRFSNFDIELPAMLGWALVAFAIGVTFGALFKRSLPALLATLLSFAALRIFVVAQVRPYYMPPLQTPTVVTAPPDAWLFDHRFVDASGHEVDPGRVAALIQGFNAHIAEFQGNLNRYLEQNGVFQPQLYQPAERFWIFQGIEFAILLGASLICVFIALWLVRRVKA